MLRFDRVTTPRLVLRRWQLGDLDSFAALNFDPEVMRHFPSTYDRSATAAMITAWEAKIDRQGFGLWAVEASIVLPDDRGQQARWMPRPLVDHAPLADRSSGQYEIGPALAVGR
jgi:RimJ/RimL family protein N-acetyltransferase